jgi:isopropylmalate/homocitrate/citramalate synthase
MPPLRLTAEQYKSCWADRIEREKELMASTTAETKARVAAHKAAVEANEAEQQAIDAEDAVSALSSTASSRVSGLSASVSRVDRLEIKLEQERRKREALEKALERARQPSLVM